MDVCGSVLDAADTVGRCRAAAAWLLSRTTAGAKRVMRRDALTLALLHVACEGGVGSEHVRAAASDRHMVGMLVRSSQVMKRWGPGVEVWQ